MGLDQYLRASQYIGRWEYMKGDERKEYAKADAILEASGMADAQVENAGIDVRTTAMYWRKANQVHAWFVKNVQGGVDDCGTYHVTEDQIRSLRDTAELVLHSVTMVPDMVTNGQHLGPETDGKWVPTLESGEQIMNPSIAQELLPATEGFFFGGTDYDQWYVDDLKRTIEGLTRVLELEGDFEFYYESSW